MDTNGQTAEFGQWAILELMGHRRVAGWLTEATLAGGTFLRIDIPDGATQFYSPSAVYAITPTTEDVAQRVAKLSQPEPVRAWELPSARDEEPAF